MLFERIKILIVFIQDIIQNARELQSAEDEIVVLERDLEECNLKLNEQDQVINKVQAIIERVEVLNRPDMSLEKAYEVLADLKVTKLGICVALTTLISIFSFVQEYIKKGFGLGSWLTSREN